jgi:hypothetical protein
MMSECILKEDFMTTALNFSRIQKEHLEPCMYVPGARLHSMGPGAHATLTLRAHTLH